MTKENLIEQLRAARAAGERPSAPDADLRGVDLSGTDLRVADLRDAELRYANLSGADLSGADLSGADLWGADLCYANLRDADLRGADLRSANLLGAKEVLQVTGLPSGQVILTPTCAGWSLRVAYWEGTVDDLEALIASDDGWPEAWGAECAAHRPSLEALIMLCRAHIARHPGVIEALEQKWGGKK